VRLEEKKKKRRTEEDKKKRRRETYKPITPAKISVKIIPTKYFGWWQTTRTPISPVIAVDQPVATPERPAAMPAARSMYPAASG
jgi:hypothetical protein